MASLDEMIRLGYKPKQNTAQQIMGLLTGAQQQLTEQDKKRQEDEQNQQKLYMTLRENGYSAEEATKKVGRTYRSTDFIENMVNGKNENPLNQPSGEDKFSLDTQKAKADLEKTAAETTLAKSKATYYDAGGPKRTVIDKMTPNQLQARIKYLESMKGTLDTPEDNSNIEEELKYLNQKVQGITGFKTQIPENSPTAEANRIMNNVNGQKKVIMTSPDGKKWKVLPERVKEAKANGWK